MAKPIDPFTKLLKKPSAAQRAKSVRDRPVVYTGGEAREFEFKKLDAWQDYAKAHSEPNDILDRISVKPPGGVDDRPAERFLKKPIRRRGR